ncbi:anthranilate phosphoribosyltransferase [Parasaccharibacter apium]|uniref:Anthranilate phosphoribosyltransferase n=1 Tax=Parasaccharibacter apium TaxID=1510841 RepID=A0ABX4ZMG3_9PROT|nr:anthranilate phosphoribosyltransferase [Parasaccharibacter apium]POS61277.1 anthranilate phosphoribosyltransferase [Parasaccharibacter apium]POS62835.1 anthranilate phosphoribosyltransferase [Parasaccharibacter apium]POS62936.1 anthranilate phosphoribosyltransferase [Parasaccharibacter apium]
MGGQEKPFASFLRKVAARKELDVSEAEQAFRLIMQGAVSDIELAAFLTALQMRGETVEELSGAVQAVRQSMQALQKVPDDTVDVCGTGGDGLGTLNVSTATAFVLAGLGVSVAKHGGRALSSRAGATDVLEALGIPADADHARQEKRLRQENLAFLAAPFHHPAMRVAAPVRKQLGFRTLFNLLGPLCNPARVRRQLVGVFDEVWCRPVARVLGELGAVSAWVVHGHTDEGGIDELTLAGPTHNDVWENGEIISFDLTPEMAGLPHYGIAALKGGDPICNAQRMRALFAGETGCYRDTVLLNAAVGLHVAGRGNLLESGRLSVPALRRNVAEAARSLDEGLARKALIRAQTGVSAQD